MSYASLTRLTFAGSKRYKGIELLRNGPRNLLLRFFLYTRERSPIPVLTGPNVEQRRWSKATRYHKAKPSQSRNGSNPRCFNYSWLSQADRSPSVWQAALNNSVTSGASGQAEDGLCCRDPFHCPPRVIDAAPARPLWPPVWMRRLDLLSSEPPITYSLHDKPSNRPHVATLRLLMRPLPGRTPTPRTLELWSFRFEHIRLTWKDLWNRRCA